MFISFISRIQYIGKHALKAYKKEDVIKALNTIGDAPKSDGKMKFDFIKGKNNNERLA